MQDGLQILYPMMLWRHQHGLWARVGLPVSDWAHGIYPPNIYIGGSCTQGDNVTVIGNRGFYQSFHLESALLLIFMLTYNVKKPFRINLGQRDIIINQCWWQTRWQCQAVWHFSIKSWFSFYLTKKQPTNLSSL